MYRYQRDTCGTSASPSATSPPRSKWLSKEGTCIEASDTSSDASVAGRHDRKSHVRVMTDDDDTPPNADKQHHDGRLDDQRRPATVIGGRSAVDPDNVPSDQQQQERDMRMYSREEREQAKLEMQYLRQRLAALEKMFGCDDDDKRKGDGVEPSHKTVQ